MEPKQKQLSIVDLTGDGSKVQCCKEQYCIGIWNVRSMNQSKLKVVKQEVSRVNIDILGISKLKWTGMAEFNSDDHCIYYCGLETLRRSGVAIIVNKRVQNAAQFSHSVVSNSLQPHELQHARLTCPSPTPGVYSNSCPSRRWCHPAISSSVIPVSSCLLSFPASGSFPMIHYQTPSSKNTREDSTHRHHQMVTTKITLIIFFAAKDGEALYSQQKQDRELTVAQIMNSLLPNSDLNWRK